MKASGKIKPASNEGGKKQKLHYCARLLFEDDMARIWVYHPIFLETHWHERSKKRSKESKVIKLLNIEKGAGESAVLNGEYQE